MKYFVAFITFLSIITGSLPAAEKVTLRTIWVPQAQFAGVFIAGEKGFFKQQGLEVTILHGGPDVNALAEAANNKVDCALGWLSGGIQFASKGMPIVNVAQFFPKSMLVLITKKKTGINSIQDINKRKVGIWQAIYAVPVKTLMQAESVSPVYVKQGFDMQPFVDDEYNLCGEVTSAMLYNEYLQVISKGVAEKDLRIFNPGDYGANFPEDGLYVSRNTLSGKGAVIKKVVNAIVQGWNYTVTHQKEAVDIVMKYGATDRKHQEQMLKVISDNILRADKKVGASLSKQDFQFVYDSLKEYDQLGKKALTFEQFYAGGF